MHCLIVANETSGGTKLTGMIRDRVDVGRRSFVVVAPLTPPDEYAPSWVVPADPGWEGSVPEAGSADALLAADRAHEETERRLAAVIDRVVAAGGQARGHVADPDPETAVREALEDFEIREIILCTLPASVSQWLGMDLPSRIRRLTSLSVTTVESSEGSPLLEAGSADALGAVDADQPGDLEPSRPREQGVPEREPEAMQIEGARLLANEAGPRLRRSGFDDEQIRRWAEAFIAAEGAGDVDGFIAWIRAREAEHAQRLGAGRR